MKKIFTLAVFILFSTLIWAQSTNIDAGIAYTESVFPNRSLPQVNLYPFYHGIASGDPTKDAVIIWTRITDDLNNTPSIEVSWQFATDSLFENTIANGTVTTDSTSDFTVKVDVTGLQAYTYYYYRFYALGKYSLIGRTKTAPDALVDNLRFAVVSCSNYAHGFFNAYHQISVKDDIDAVIHLGDYIYEYGDGEFGNERNLQPPNEITDLQAYRTRHSYYKLDPDLRDIHQHFPFITTWDDHETANNSWYSGASNHDAGEGNWFDRKTAGIRSYYEWMPLRQPDPSDDERIYRTIHYGDLADIFVLDTRLEGRDEPVAFGDVAGMDDPNRTILGADQRAWLANELSTSTAQWKILAQQVMVAPLNVLGLTLNTDQWDGYTADRNFLYDHVLNNNIENLVVLTGDIHTSWANDLPHYNGSYDDNTGANSVGVEFVTASVTSLNAPFDIPFSEDLVSLANPHMKYIDFDQHGYILLDLKADKAQGEWYYVPSITEMTVGETLGASWYVNSGERHLNIGTAITAPLFTPAPQTSNCPPTGVAIQLKVYLEGPYDYGVGYMNSTYSGLNLLPLDQPFNTTPWNYTGTEAVVNNTDIPNHTVDWVLVELRDVLDNSIVIDAAAGFLKRNGEIVNVASNYQKSLVFYGVEPNESYYALVRARNHLATMTAMPINLPNNLPYDFTSGIAQVFGVNQMIEVGPGVYAQYAGDMDANGIINYTDFNVYSSQVLQNNQYLPADLEFNRTITTSDFELYQNNGSVIGVNQVRY